MTASIRWRAQRRPLGLALALALAGLATACAAQDTAGLTPQESVSLLDARVPEEATPAAACVGPDEALADQVVKLHTEIMVTSLTCEVAFAEPELYNRYRLFTQRQADLLRRSQDRLEKSFIGSAEDPARAFDAYRTEVANDEAKQALAYSTPRYCRIKSHRFNSLIDAEPENFEAYAEDLALRRVARQSGC